MAYTEDITCHATGYIQGTIQACHTDAPGHNGLVQAYNANHMAQHRHVINSSKHCCIGRYVPDLAAPRLALTRK